jgi:hypothetical protein
MTAAALCKASMTMKEWCNLHAGCTVEISVLTTDVAASNLMK